MTSESLHTLLAATISFIFVISVLILGRKQRLSFRYTIGWMTLGGIGVVAGALLPLIGPIADQFRLSPSAVLSIGAILLLLVLCVQLSISISGNQEQIKILTQELAILKEKINRTEAKKHE
jgi:hypothetical protein